MTTQVSVMPDRLAEIRARLDAATPGPWDYDHITRNVEADSRWLPDKRHVVAPMVGHFDGTLIAHAPADIAWLLDEVDSLRERVAILRTEVTDLEDARA
jgi:ubiquinone biosynthesis protein UbiJ